MAFATIGKHRGPRPARMLLTSVAAVFLVAALAGRAGPPPAAGGSVDRSFGTVITPVGTGGGSAAAVAIQHDGRIVVAGSAIVGDGAFAVARYRANGNLDASFGTGGIVLTDFGG